MLYEVITTVNEILDDLEVDVGLEQRETHLAQALANVLLGQLSLTAKLSYNFV